MPTEIIEVSVGSSTQRKTVQVNSNMTAAEVFEQEGITYDGAVIYFNGAPMDYAQLDQPLNTFSLRAAGRTNLLTAIVKADSAC